MMHVHAVVMASQEPQSLYDCDSTGRYKAADSSVAATSIGLVVLMRDDLSEALEAMIQTHLLDCVSGYRGSLQLAMDAAGNGWLPSSSDERVSVLVRHLVQAGGSEPDVFLVRVGLTVPGIQRGIRPPLLVLSESRGGLSAARMAEAVGQVERLGEALAVGRYMQPGLSSDTGEAISELFSLLPKERAATASSQIDLYGRLSEAEASQLAAVAVDFLGGGTTEIRRIGGEILQRLACFRFQPLDPAVCGSLVQRALLCPASVYRDAPESVATELHALLVRPRDRVAWGHLLSSLAWTRSEKAREAFWSWRENPPEWTSHVLVPPSSFLYDAGWSLDATGNRRDLASTVCFRLLPDRVGESSRVDCFGRAEGNCIACRSTLCLLFDFSEFDLSALGEPWAEAPRRILTCVVCSCYGTVFADYRGGFEALHRPCTDAEFVEDAWLPDPTTRSVSAARFPPFATAEPFALDDASTLGGVPSWVQDPDYPVCPRCSAPMMFLAQFDNGSVGEEGIYYAFFCGNCRISAVNYQQT